MSQMPFPRNLSAVLLRRHAFQALELQAEVLRLAEAEGEGFLVDVVVGDFLTAVSHNRFVELMPRVFQPGMIFMKLTAFGE